MTLITILILIIGVVVLMAACLLGLSYAFGTHLHSRECPRESPTAADPCAQCNADREWYLGLPMWKQTMATTWWWANRISCGAKGCK